MGGKFIPTVLEVMNPKGDNITLEEIFFEGFNGVLCVEARETLDVVCVRREMIAAFEKLATLNVFEVYQPHSVRYDVLGDVVCDGISMPICNRIC